jgi:hypothetical protein
MKGTGIVEIVLKQRLTQFKGVWQTSSVQPIFILKPSPTSERRKIPPFTVLEKHDGMRQVQAKLRDMSIQSEGLTRTCGELDKDNAKQQPPPPPSNCDEQLQTNFVVLSLYWEVARYTTSQRCCCLCMEPEFSFPYRQLAAGSYSEPLEFIPHSRAPFPSSRLLFNVFVPYIVCLRLASDHFTFPDKYCV